MKNHKHNESLSQQDDEMIDDDFENEVVSGGRHFIKKSTNSERKNDSRTYGKHDTKRYKR
jgi:hypothetical protein